jgi:Rps23 Pro-64 3,4-dihydroxylase Tpa1-like proline 4-hydroxylase
MTLLEAKESLYSKGYCDFDLKDFNEDFYNLFLNIKYKESDTKYLDEFTVVRFDLHDDRTDTHIQSRDVFNNFKEANVKKLEILNSFDKEYMAQLWLQAQATPYVENNAFPNVYYRILEYFYNKNEEDTNCGLQWTCYSEDCFLKDHNDGQGDTYQNTCAILIYLNEEWEEEWGGNLILRNTKNTNDKNISYKVVPKFGKVAIIDLETFDTSHAVETVIGNHNRCTLLAFATAKEKRKPKFV